jgi:integrase
LPQSSTGRRGQHGAGPLVAARDDLKQFLGSGEVQLAHWQIMWFLRRFLPSGISCRRSAIGRGVLLQPMPAKELPEHEGVEEVSLYKRGGIWWFKFKFLGQLFRESTKSRNKNIAIAAERMRRDDLAHGFNRIAKPSRVLMFSVAAEQWLESKIAALSPRSVTIERLNLKHLNPVLGNMLLSDINANHIGAYQLARRKEKAAPKTINLEMGTLRAILRRNRRWADIQPDVKMLTCPEVVGPALTQHEETALLRECLNSRSRFLYVVVVMGLATCMRYCEIRRSLWSQIDFERGELRVGKSKTPDGANRVIPLSQRIRIVLEFWAARFPHRKPDHYVFPSERYGGQGREEAFGFKGSVAYDTDPTRPIGNWKEAWEAAKIRAGVACRFHDLRHTGCTRMLEAGVPLSVVSDILGWSPSTMVRMARRYGHIGNEARKKAITALSSATTWDQEGAQRKAAGGS